MLFNIDRKTKEQIYNQSLADMMSLREKNFLDVCIDN